jgi:molecular chaperone GrpE
MPFGGYESEPEDEGTSLSLSSELNSDSKSENVMNEEAQTEISSDSDHPHGEERVPVPENGADPIQEELETLKDRHLRLAAEFDNFRKRSRDEVLQASTRGQATLLSTLMDVIDDFQRMHEVDPATATLDSVLEGLVMVDRKLGRLLADFGLEMIDPTGDPFDPATMEAVLRIPTAEAEEDDRVDQVLQRGAIFKGHLVRPARVAVRKLEG